MFQYGLSCALEALPERQPVVLRGSIEEVAQGAKEAGYRAVELHIKNPAQYDPNRLMRAIQNEGMRYCGIATGMEYTVNKLSLIDSDKKIRRAAVERLKEHIALAKELDCPVVIGIMRGNISDFDAYKREEDRLSKGLLELADYAQEIGVELVFESIMRYINNYLNTVPETADYLKKLGRSNLKLHIDTHSMIVEDADLPAAIRYSEDILGYVHFSDSNRRYPGGGNIDFMSAMQALIDVEYKGYITCECLPYPSPSECAVLGMEYLKALESCIRIKNESKKR